MPLLPFKRFCREHEGWAWLAAIMVPLAVIAVGCLVWPELFWDRFVWRHIWAPLVADAEDRAVDGVGEGYTVVSTVTYAAFLSLAVFGIWRAFQRPGIALDGRFLLALVPWVVAGAVARALEDAHLFAPGGPVVYLFISPVIYVFEGVLVFVLVMLSWRAERLGARRGWRERQRPWRHRRAARVRKQHHESPRYDAVRIHFAAGQVYGFAAQRGLQRSAIGYPAGGIGGHWPHGAPSSDDRNIGR